MLSKRELNDSIDYNKIKSGILFEKSELIWPLSDIDICSEFSWIVYCFQIENELFADGKLGPKTFFKMKKNIREKDDTLPGKPKNKMKKYSNRIIVDNEMIPVPDDILGLGISVSNYIDDNEPYFKRSKRVKELRNFVLHETCGNTARGCKNTLIRKNYGVHFILAPDGHLSCHGDLARDVMIHANQLNKYSIGIEVVNPYNPIFISKQNKDVFTNIIPARWWTWVPKKNGNKINEYICPTEMQMNVIYKFVPWVCNIVGIPFVFPTKNLSRRNRRVKMPSNGIVAHRDLMTRTCHADGRYILERLIENSL